MTCRKRHVRNDGPNRVVRFSAVLNAGAALLLISPDVHAAETARLIGLVNASMEASVEAAIIRGDRVVEIVSPGGEAGMAWVIGEKLREAGVAVRCVDVCASAAAQILFTSGHCIVARQGRLILHRPQIAQAGLSASAFAVLDGIAMRQWHVEMAKAGVPDDLVFRTEQAFRGELELNDYAVKRMGCAVE